jgi:centromere/kinetochore protein ZW10
MDVFELDTIGVNDSHRIATTLTEVEGLSDLFVKPSEPKSTPPSPMRTRSHPVEPMTIGEKEEGDADELNKKKEEGATMAALFVPLWFRLNFLNQVLQSNLKEIRFLWFESDLSLYFEKEEVLDLLRLSFEMNANVRAVVREIERSNVGKGKREG